MPTGMLYYVLLYIYIYSAGRGPPHVPQDLCPLVHSPSNYPVSPSLCYLITCTRILVQVTIYRRLLIGRDGHLDQSETYDIS